MSIVCTIEAVQSPSLLFATVATPVVEPAIEQVCIGKTVKVVKGRKVPINTIGKVFYMQPYNYRCYGRQSRTAPLQYKVGLALDNTKDARGRHSNVVWTYAHNCQVVQQEIPATAPRLDGQPAYATSDACMVPA